MEEARSVKHLKIGVGMNEHGQVVQINHAAGPNKKIFVVPGKYAQIEITNQSINSVTFAEVPLGAYGWEYELA